MRFAVFMRKQNIDNPWVSYKWIPQEVLPDHGQFSELEAGSKAIVGEYLGKDANGENWIFTGYELNLFPDEAEGYYLNIAADNPCWFVMWRLEEDFVQYIDSQSLAMAKDSETIAVPHRICLSYNEAARLMDGGESVDAVPLSIECASWLQDYVNTHYKPEPKKRHRPASFKGAERPAEE